MQNIREITFHQKKIVYIQKTDLNAERGTYLIVVMKKFQKSIDFS